MATKLTLREVLQGASSFLETKGVEGYSILYVFLARKGWNKTQWLLNMAQLASPEDQQQVAEDTKKLANHLPPQYLLGYEEFYGHHFKVTKDTLIPRPETEELVAAVLNSKNAVGKLSPEITVVADIGCGTGAIAISLKLDRPNWQVLATDISPLALAVAKENADKLKAPLQFFQGDVLTPLIERGIKVDLLVSNPPYIAQSEWELMDESVRTYEPKLALFADHEGLAIYEKIAQQAPQILKAEGEIFLEIGFAQGKVLQKLFQQAFPSKKVTIQKDLAGQDRILHVFAGDN